MLENYIENLFERLRAVEEGEELRRLWDVRDTVRDIERLCEYAVADAKSRLAYVDTLAKERLAEIETLTRTITVLERQLSDLEGRSEDYKNLPKMAKRILAFVAMPKARITRHARVILAETVNDEYVVAMQYGDSPEDYDDSWDNGEYYRDRLLATQAFIDTVEKRKSGFFGCEEETPAVLENNPIN